MNFNITQRFTLCGGRKKCLSFAIKNLNAALRVTALLGVLVFCVNHVQASSMETNSFAEAAVGKQAKTFKRMAAEGKEVNLLEDFKGKFVVLEWWNHKCPFVEKHYDTGNMQKLQKKYGSRDNVSWVRVVSSAKGKQGFVTSDETKKLNSEHKTSATATLFDPSGEMGRWYGARTTPHMYIINPEGQLIYMGAIDDKPTTDTDDIDGATNYVSLALDQALAGKKIETSSTEPYGCSVKYASK
jgi:hypothetical protein